MTFLANFPGGNFAERARVKRALQSPAPVPAPEPEPASLAFWESIKDSPNPVDYEAYLRQHPEGHFAALARARLTAVMEAQHREAKRRDAERKAAEEAKRKAAKEARRKEAERVAAEKERRAAKKLKDAQTAAVVPTPTQDTTDKIRDRQIEQWGRKITTILLKGAGVDDKNPTKEQIRLAKEGLLAMDQELRKLQAAPTSGRISSGALRATIDQCIYDMNQEDLGDIGKELCGCFRSNLQQYISAQTFKKYAPSYGVFNFNKMPKETANSVSMMLAVCFIDFM